MRPLEDIRADWNTWSGFGTTISRHGWVAAASARDRLLTDIPGLLAEIERLKADLAQSRSAITKLSREIWKVC